MIEAVQKQLIIRIYAAGFALDRQIREKRADDGACSEIERQGRRAAATTQYG